ncbi:dUTP pyrophosphatase [Spodoptera litura nucleopolyhedrovirus]|uniref:dUTP diphosphatase n=1 Tax=Spodoptera litura multicapsid nucleopolyhedrovirus TaxID=46242 RepID=Q91BK5_NPVST|nr:dUTP pyrophosphatase [Spodoptera litura nucleopolyhedrovirus]AAL01696.1 dUTP pyrophosphatase [Spodoptera litura nucleopolyhedrovirus]
MDNNFVVETSVEQQFVINMKQIESRPQLKYLKLSEHAYEPTYGSDGAAGLDLKSAHDYIIKSNSRAVIKTDLAICIPKDCYARIAPRSGLSVKHSIDVGAGVIDHDYRGNVGIVLINNGEFNFVIIAETEWLTDLRAYLQMRARRGGIFGRNNTRRRRFCSTGI